MDMLLLGHGIREQVVGLPCSVVMQMYLSVKWNKPLFWAVVRIAKCARNICPISFLKALTFILFAPPVVLSWIYLWYVFISAYITTSNITAMCTTLTLKWHKDSSNWVYVCIRAIQNALWFMILHHSISSFQSILAFSLSNHEKKMFFINKWCIFLPAQCLSRVVQRDVPLPD